MTVAELEPRCRSRAVRLGRLEAFHEPLPDRLADLHSGLLALVVNLVRRPMPAGAASDFFVIRDREATDDGLSEVDRQMAHWRGG